MSRSLVRNTVFAGLARRTDDPRSIHRRAKIVNLVKTVEARRELADDLTRSANLRWRINASQLDYLRVGDLLTIVFMALPGKTTTKPSGGD